MNIKIWSILIIVFVILANIDFSTKAENKIIPISIYNDYLIAVNPAKIEVINSYYMIRAEKIDIIRQVADEEKIPFIELYKQRSFK